MRGSAIAAERRGRGGFTILELLLTLVTLAVIASLAIPYYFERAEVSLENAAIQLAEDVRLAQNRAAYLGRSTRLEFDSDGGGYRVVEESPGASEEVKVRRYDRDGVFEGVSIRAVDLGGGGTALRFDGRGRALNGGRVELAFCDETRALRVTPSTGHLAILGSTSGWTDDGL